MVCVWYGAAKIGEEIRVTEGVSNAAKTELLSTHPHMRASSVFKQ